MSGKTCTWNNNIHLCGVGKLHPRACTFRNGQCAVIRPSRKRVEKVCPFLSAILYSILSFFLSLRRPKVVWQKRWENPAWFEENASKSALGTKEAERETGDRQIRFHSVFGQTQRTQLLSDCSTDPFTTLVLQNPSHDVSELHQIRWFLDL